MTKQPSHAPDNPRDETGIAPHGSHLKALLVDDEPDTIAQCKDLLPIQIADENIDWAFAETFDEASHLLEKQRFDILVTDIYKGRRITGKIGIDNKSNHAKNLVATIRNSGFSLVILYSDGPMPDDMLSSPSIRFVDKSNPTPPFPESIVDVLTGLLMTRGKILSVIMNIRSELERSTGSYVWDFIDQHWDNLSKDPAFLDAGLERLIRRRAAIQINEIRGEAGFEERQNADKYDYYIYPALPGDFRLGTIIKQKSNNDYFVVLTPHCHLASQTKKNGEISPPKADSILLAQCIEAKSFVRDNVEPASLRIPARTTLLPDGRHCFIPGFLDLPDMYCDLMKLTSVPIANVTGAEYERIATIDSPFAEAIQSSLTRLYSAVGNRNLDPAEFEHLSLG